MSGTAVAVGAASGAVGVVSGVSGFSDLPDSIKAFQGTGNSSGGNNDIPKVESKIDESSKLVKEAEKMGKNQDVQREANELIQQFLEGNANPGIGSKHLQGNIYYLRGRNGARVFYRMNNGVMEILGKASKANEQVVINTILQLYS